MAVYVDELQHYPNAPRRGRWCHMVADTHDELMAMATTIGHKPEWLQSPGTAREHFDLCGESKRAKAIAAGAVPITLREMGHLTLRKANALAKEGER